MYLGGIDASAVVYALRDAPVTHTGRMDIYQLPNAVVRVAVDALEFTGIRCQVDSTPLADGRRLVTIVGVNPLY